MNYIFISPNFPKNFKHFAIALKKENVNALGIGSDSFDSFDQDLKGALAGYYQVGNPENYQELLKACGYFTHRYGKIDIIESHNEHWLKADARLRTDFNVSGYQEKDIDKILKKSEMKKVFEKIGIPTAKGLIANNFPQIKRWAKEIDYPLILKPNIGVGAAGILKINDEESLESFFKNKDETEYLAEEFIAGDIHTFDGLIDLEGRLIFQNSFAYGTGVFDTVSKDLDQFYYSQIKIPADILAESLKILEAYDIRGRFFHIEFFRTKEDELVGLEVNFRPPGGHSLDMFNYGSDIDVYSLYAQMISGQKINKINAAKYHVAYIGVKENRPLYHNRREFLEKFQDKIIAHGFVPEIFSLVMGDYYYLLRSQNIEDIKASTGFIVLDI